MPTQSIINQFRTVPKGVQDLVGALQASLEGQADAAGIRSFLYPAQNDSRERWNEYIDAAESLGLVTRDPLETNVTDDLDEQAFGRTLRRRFREEERSLDTNALVYIAYRAALELETDISGGVPNTLIDRAELRATQLLGPSPQRRYDGPKMERWRRWVAAAGLGFDPQPTSASVFVVCPVVALFDELDQCPTGSEIAVSDFITLMDVIPMLPTDANIGDTLPIGPAAALLLLEERGALRLAYHADARREWHLPGRPAAVTHVEVMR